MPIRVLSAGFILFLGLAAARNEVGPSPTAKELAARGKRTSAVDSIYETSQLLCEIDSPDVCESSGLVRCASDARLLWTHNDSGGEPAIVAFDREGKIHGVVQIEGARNRDWEEMTSFSEEGIPWLIVADCGNNAMEDRTAILYFFREPSPIAEKVACDLQLEVRFETGGCNCEAVTVDPFEKKILFVSKVVAGRCEVFETPLPSMKSEARRLETRKSKSGVGDVAQTVTAKRIGAPEITLATGMCLSADGRRLVVVNYRRGFEFHRTEGETWTTVFARPPRKIELTWRMDQREAVCFDDDDRSLLMTSEARRGLIGTLTGASQSNVIPLWRVPAKPAGKGSLSKDLQ